MYKVWVVDHADLPRGGVGLLGANGAREAHEPE